jgi:hypothetical protein
VLGGNPSDLKNLIEHLAVLAGDAHAYVGIGAAERVDQGKELDRFGARPKDHEDAGTCGSRHEYPFPDWPPPDKPHSSAARPPETLAPTVAWARRIIADTPEILA